MYAASEVDPRLIEMEVSEYETACHDQTRTVAVTYSARSRLLPAQARDAVP